MKVTINVTEDDILTGIRGICVLCPIARAINRVLSDNEYFAVVGNYLHISDYKESHFRKVVVLPKVARAFINSFDEGEGVMPFSFELDIEDKYLKQSELLNK